MDAGDMSGIGEELGCLLEKIYRERGFDLRDYKETVLTRRLGRRLRARGAETYASYARVLDQDAAEYDVLFNDLTINVTSFFRDDIAFRALEDVVLQGLTGRGESADSNGSSPQAPIIKSLKLVPQIKRHSPKVPVILLAEAEDEELLFLGVKLGAAAYLTKGSTAGELVGAIKRTFQGEYLINETVMTNPRVASRILRQFQELPYSHLMVRGEEPLLSALSPREVEVLKCIAQGNSNKHIGHILCISEQTVKNHVSSIMRKLVANDRTHAVIIALRQGLIEME